MYTLQIPPSCWGVSAPVLSMAWKAITGIQVKWMDGDREKMMAVRVKSYGQAIAI